MISVDSISNLPENNFTITRVLIRGLAKYAEVGANVAQMDIYESLEGLVTGRVYLLDVVGIIDILNMTSEEGIDIQFASKKGNLFHREWRKSYRITNYYKTTSPTGRTDAVCIEFCNQADIENNAKKKSQTYRDKSTSEVIESILSDFNSIDMSKVDIEPTLYQRTFTAAVQRPFSVIRRMLDNSASKLTRSCQFYFYEDRDGIKTRSLGNLKQNQTPEYTLQQEAGSVKAYTNGEVKNIPAKRITLVRGVDASQRDRYGCRTITHSLINKTIITQDMTEDKLYRDNPMLNSEDLVREPDIVAADRPFNSVMILPGDGYYRDGTKLPQGHIQSVSHMERARIDRRVVNAQIPGNTDLTVGNLVNLKMVSIENESSNNLSGVYIISKIHHIITTTRYVMDLELITDSKQKERGVQS
ncbi:tail protein [Vibrio phage EniLVp02]